MNVAVKTQEVGRVLRLSRRSLRGAVSAESGDDADLARLLVTDYQHVLFITLFPDFVNAPPKLKLVF